MFSYSFVMSPDTVWNNVSPASVSCLLPLVVFPYPPPHFLGALSGKGNNCACLTQTLQYSHYGINQLPAPTYICWALESKVLPMRRVEVSKGFAVVPAGEEGYWQVLPRMLGESVLNTLTSVFARLTAEGKDGSWLHPLISIRIIKRLQKPVRVLGLLFKITYPSGWALGSLESPTVAARSPPTSILLAPACRPSPTHSCDALMQEVVFGNCRTWRRSPSRPEAPRQGGLLSFAWEAAELVSDFIKL